MLTPEEHGSGAGAAPGSPATQHGYPDAAGMSPQAEAVPIGDGGVVQHHPGGLPDASSPASSIHGGMARRRAVPDSPGSGHDNGHQHHYYDHEHGHDHDHGHHHHHNQHHHQHGGGSARFADRSGPRWDYDAPVLMPHAFAYNARVALLLGPCMLVLYLFAGNLAWYCFLGAVLGSWISEAVGNKLGVMYSVVGSASVLALGLVVIAFTSLTPTVFNVFLVTLWLMYLVQLVSWALLNLPFMHQYGPMMLIFLERIIWGSSLLPVSCIETWALTAVLGYDDAPFYLSVCLTINYLLLGGLNTTPSSFCSHKAALPINSQVTELINPVMVAATPYMFYCFLRQGILTHNTLLHVSNLVLLMATPLLLIWFTTRDPSIAHTAMTLGAGGVWVWAIEYRVLLSPTGYAAYIPLTFPWNYTVVTLVLVLGVLLAASISRGALRAVSPLQLAVVGAPSAILAGVMLGMPWYLLWSPALALGASFFFLRHRTLPWFALAVGGGAIAIAWWVTHTYMHVAYSFHALRMPMSTASMLFALAAVGALAIPGLTLIPDLMPLLPIALLLHAVGMVLLEWVVWDAFRNGYPLYFLLSTAAAGVYLAFRLHAAGQVPQPMAWLLTCVHLSKLGLLLTPSDMPVPSMFMLVLPIARLLWFADSSAPGVPAGRMSKTQGMIHAASIALCVLLTRHYSIARALALLLGRDPSETLIWAACLCVWSVACLPLAFRFFPFLPLVRRTLLISLTVGVLLANLQPDVASLADIAGSKHHMIRAAGTAPPPAWTPWLLVIACAVVMAGVAGLFQLQRHSSSRLLFALVLGALLGPYTSITYFPPVAATASALAAGVIFATGLAIALTLLLTLLLFMQWPSPTFVKLLPWFYAVFVALLPLLAVQARPVFAPGLRGKENLLTARATLYGMYAVLNVIIGLFVKVQVTTRSAGMVTSTRSGTRARQLGRSSGSSVQSSNVAALDFHWLPAVGNSAIVLAFLASVFTNLHYLGGSETSVFFLAPVLLLLNPDGQVFRSLNEGNRYFPILASTTAFLILRSLWFIAGHSPWGQAVQNSAWIVTSAGDVFFEPFSWFTTLKNLLLLLITMPTAYEFTLFLWSWRKQSIVRWMVLIPMNFLPLFLTDVLATRILALLCCLGGFIVIFMTRQMQKHGLKYL